MKRLPAVIAVLLLLMVCVAGAQPMGKLPRVGILITANPRLYDPFVEELRRLGYVDGQNIVLEFRNAEGRIERFPALWDASGADQFKAAEAASLSLGLRVQSLKIRPNPDDLSGAFAAAVRERADAIAVVQTAVLFRERAQIVQMATSHRLPAAFAFREFAETGGLMSYGAHLPDMFRRAAFYVDRILKGARAGDLPMEQPTKFELVINLKTAKALGLTVPQTLLLRADQVIE